jgi:phosphoglycolate phosphatase-like HAD superfamily hydrolase
MKEQDRTEFVRIMNGTAVVYGSSLTPEALGIWWNAFHEWTLDQFREGMSAAVTRTAFMPRPADVFDIRRAARPTAGEAWEIAGQGRDELADRALSIATQGRYFGHIDFEEHQWIQKRFLQVYDDLLDVEQSREVARQLAGPSWTHGNPPARLTFRNADGKDVDQYGRARIGHDPEITPEGRANLNHLRRLLAE